MKIGVLIFSRPEEDVASGIERLEEAGRSRGHEVVRLYETTVSVMNVEGRIEVRLNEQPLGTFDAIITRPNFIEEPSLHTPLIEALEHSGYRILNRAEPVALAKNKLVQRIRFQKAGILMPAWTIVHTVKEARRAASLFNFPMMVKVPFGTWGAGVFYAENLETLQPIMHYLQVRDGNPAILEEFIAEANRKDVRVFVVGGKIVAAMERSARAGDVRSNTSIGGSGSPITLTDEEQRLALAATKTCGLDIAGVDILRSSRGPLVIEINANPGFAELERVSGVDVAGQIIEFAVS
jgi:ribosomal protein S6--L-glutamate ligase